MRKRLIILGSTGSIGRNTLEVVEHLRDDWIVVGLAAGSQTDELSEQVNRFRPEAVALADGGRVKALERRIAVPAEVFGGQDALVRLVDQVECDAVVCAVVGVGGLAATVRAVELGKRIALANKESLVTAGSILMPLARDTGAEIIPIDSEHSALFQVLQAGKAAEVHRLWLTASGGPFRGHTGEQMESVTISEALRHPTWDMGPKITIDSATMMNKALEVVEARWLFGMSPERIEVVVHPESVVHSMVEFCDGSIVAQLGTPDMRTPIQYALTFPDRRDCLAPRLDFHALERLNFAKPDLERFPALRLGYDVAARGGTCGAVLNAANEAAVELFRQGSIGFRDIARQTERVLLEHEFKPDPDLGELLKADRWARNEVVRCTAC